MGSNVRAPFIFSNVVKSNSNHAMTEVYRCRIPNSKSPENNPPLYFLKSLVLSITHTWFGKLPEYQGLMRTGDLSLVIILLVARSEDHVLESCREIFCQD